MTVPVEIWEQTTWEVLDPNTAQLVAIFYDEAKAKAYIESLNAEMRSK